MSRVQILSQSCGGGVAGEMAGEVNAWWWQVAGGWGTVAWW